jgi:hypothetical protein
MSGRQQAKPSAWLLVGGVSDVLGRYHCAPALPDAKLPTTRRISTSISAFCCSTLRCNDMTANTRHERHVQELGTSVSSSTWLTFGGFPPEEPDSGFRTREGLGRPFALPHVRLAALRLLPSSRGCWKSWMRTRRRSTRWGALPRWREPQPRAGDSTFGVRQATSQ